MNLEFIKKFIKKEKKVIGLEISDSFLSAVEIEKKNGKLKLLARDTVKLEPGIIENGEIVNSSEVRNSFLKLFKNYIFHKQKPVIFFNVKNNRTYYHFFKKREDMDIDDQIDEEAFSSIPLNKNNLELKYKKLPERKLDYVLIAKDKKFYKDWEKFLASIEHISFPESERDFIKFGLDNQEKDNSIILEISENSLSLSLFYAGEMIYSYLVKADLDLSFNKINDYSFSIKEIDKVNPDIKKELDSIYKEVLDFVDYIDNKIYLKVPKVITISEDVEIKELNKFLYYKLKEKGLDTEMGRHSSFDKLENSKSIVSLSLAIRAIKKDSISFFLKENIIRLNLRENILNYFSREMLFKYKVQVFLGFFIFVSLLVFLISLDSKENIKIITADPYIFSTEMELNPSMTIGDIYKENEVRTRFIEIEFDKPLEYNEIMTQGEKKAREALLDGEVFAGIVTELKVESLVFPMKISFAVCNREDLEKIYTKEISGLTDIDYKINLGGIKIINNNENYDLKLTIDIKTKNEFEIEKKGIVEKEIEVVREEVWVKIKDLNSKINIRVGPGTSYSVVDKGNPGEKYVLLEKGAIWSKVEITEGVEGWIINDLLIF